MRNDNYKLAPEDSNEWKCKWASCEYGLGLAGNGMCSARGHWDKSDCEYFKEATCEHNVLISTECAKCKRINEAIMKRLYKELRELAEEEE